MVEMIEMGHFVQEDMILQGRGKKDQAPVEGDAPGLAAGSPARLLVPDRDSMGFQAVIPGKLQQAGGEEVPCDPAQQGHRRPLSAPPTGQRQANPPPFVLHEVAAALTSRSPLQLIPVSGKGEPGMALEVLPQAENARLPGKGPADPFPVFLKETSSVGSRLPLRQLQDDEPLPVDLDLHPLDPRGALHPARHHLRPALGMKADQVKGFLRLLRFHE